ncbi:MAG: cation-transporting P-type ATPase, partial [Gammaproteobacteria bacterium]
MTKVDTNSPKQDNYSQPGSAIADARLATPHAVSADEILTTLQASRHGLKHAVANERLAHYGRNALPR